MCERVHACVHSPHPRGLQQCRTHPRSPPETLPAAEKVHVAELQLDGRSSYGMLDCLQFCCQHLSGDVPLPSPPPLPMGVLLLQLTCKCVSSNYARVSPRNMFRRFWKPDVEGEVREAKTNAEISKPPYSEPPDPRLQQLHGINADYKIESSASRLFPMLGTGLAPFRVRSLYYPTMVWEKSNYYVHLTDGEIEAHWGLSCQDHKTSVW